MLKCFILTKYRLCQSSLLQTTRLLIHIFQSSNHYLFGVLILVSSPLSHLFQFFHIFFNSCHWCSKFCTHNCKVTDGCLFLTLFNFFFTYFQVGDTQGFWIWMANIFAPGIYATSWYNGDDQNNTAYISDKVSILVGIPRIRQLRIRQGECSVKRLFFWRNKPCKKKRWQT